MALRPDSPAIDAGNPGGCTDHNNQSITTDQLGTLRPLDGNNNDLMICDIGAFEFDPSHPIRLINLPMIMN
jgi:hypothetical protein